MPIVSVIVPVHNSEKFLGQCLDSILNQTLKDIEILCINDGSTDSSNAILKKYASVDRRITLFSQRCGGAGSARNLGLQHARGRYLSFLDSDDFFEPTMLEESVNQAEENNADIVVYGAWLYNSTNNQNRPARWLLPDDMAHHNESITPKQIADKIFDSFGNYTWNKLFRASFIQSENISFQCISRTNDLLFTCSALVKATRIVVMDRYFTHYRVATGTSLQSTNDRDPLAFLTAFSALEAFLNKQGLFPLYKKSFYNHLVESVCYNANSVKSMASLTQIATSVKKEIEPSFHICDSNSALVKNQSALKQYNWLITQDITDYLFMNLRLTQAQLDASDWYSSSVSQYNVTLETERDALRDECDSLHSTINCLESDIQTLRNRRALKMADWVHSLLNP